jgi:hypothetical protein
VKITQNPVWFQGVSLKSKIKTWWVIGGSKNPWWVICLVGCVNSTTCKGLSEIAPAGLWPVFA